MVHIQDPMLSIEARLSEELEPFQPNLTNEPQRSTLPSGLETVHVAGVSANEDGNESRLRNHPSEQIDFNGHMM
jgi:hypothetical protein